MPWNPDGTFSLSQTFGTGTAPDNMFPPAVGNTLDDIANSLNINTIFGTLSATLAVTFATVHANELYDSNNRVFAQGGTAGGVANAGLVIVPFGIGTISSGTITPNPQVCLKQTVTNNGAFVIAATSQIGDVELLITNAASAGTITVSGFSKQFTGDPLTTTNGNAFLMFIYGMGTKTACIIKALQ